jgi:3',5'-cyclic AMP phosphodiesterase CpdA
MVFVKTASRSRAFTFAHLSDFHICRPEGARPGDFVNKRLLSYLSWRLRRRAEHRPEVLAAVQRSLKRIEVDQVVVTGDLTHLGLPAEFEDARVQLAALGAADRVFVVPGNHDALVAAASADPFARWADYMRSDDAAPGGRTLFPTLRRRGPVCLIGVSSACPTPPLRATGRVGAAQMKRLGEVLAAAAAARLFRVVLIHHPPAPGAVSGHKRLTDIAALGSALAEHGAELILHGHAHVLGRAADLKGPAGRSIPVLGVSSATCASPRAARRAVFRLFRVSGGPDAWQTTCEDHVYEPESGEFVPAKEIPV